MNTDRTELLLNGSAAADKIADGQEELQRIDDHDTIIFARGFGAITDIEVGPDGYLCIISLDRGEISDCSLRVKQAQDKIDRCQLFSSQLLGRIYKIVAGVEYSQF